MLGALFGRFTSRVLGIAAIVGLFGVGIFLGNLEYITASQFQAKPDQSVIATAFLTPVGFALAWLLVISRLKPPAKDRSADPAPAPEEPPQS